MLNTRPVSRPAGQGCDSYSGKRMPKIKVPKVLLFVIAVLVAVFVPGGVWLVAIAAVALKFSKKT